MFGKNLCKKCGKKVNSKDNFCSSCGSRTDSSKEWGILGKQDEANEFEKFSNEIFNGVGGGLLNKMFKSAVNMLEKEMQKEMKNSRQQKTSLHLFINGKKINLNQAPQRVRYKQSRKKIHLPNAVLKKFSEMPREEPQTDMRRLPEKIIYEINMPGVKSVEDISITPLENSTEIKAVAKDKSYFKLIPVNLPITNYILLNGKLILEIKI